MNKKILAAALAVAMLASLATSCGGSSSSSSSNGSTTTSSGATSTSTGSTSGDSDSYFTMNEAGYPVLNEPATVSVVAFGTTPEGTGAWETPNEIPFFQTQAERTGINFEWSYMTRAAWKEKVPIMIAGDDLPDVFLKSLFSDGELVKNGQDGVIVDMTPYLEDYAPDFYKYASERDLLKYLTMSGGLWGLPYIYDSEGIRLCKIFFNVDWLDAVGMEMPTNWDEIHDVLVAFRDNDANGNGDATDEIPFGAADVYDMFCMMSGEFGLMNRGISMGYSLFLDADPSDASGNTMRIWPMADSMKDMLKLAKTYYEEGLVPTSFFDSDYGTIYSNAISENQVGCHDQWATITGDYVDKYISMNNSPSELWSAVSGFLGTKGGLVITKECEIPEAMVAWGNYMYTTQGAYDYFLGVEGESYIINDEGHTELTEQITNNPDGLKSEQALLRYSIYSGGANPGLLTDDTFKGGETYWTSLEGNDKFNGNVPDVIWERVPLATDQSEAINNVKGDIDAVFQEYMAYFITGQKDIDADWQEYLDKMNAAGVETYLTNYQAAYDVVNS